MTKHLIVALALMSSLGVIAGCGSGGSSATGSSTPFQSESGTGTAILSWDSPTTNVDGTPLTDLAGYTVHIGTSPGDYTASINVGNVTTYSMNHLETGHYYFAVTAYNTSGVESEYSDEADKTI